jgi:DNA-binding MurR/RpiR family transcriptional regulator
MTLGKIEEIIRIKFTQLSPGQKKVAEFLLSNLERFAFSTASKIAREVEKSEATVVRLSYSLGFDSFSEMQKFIQEDLLNKKQVHGLLVNTQEGTAKDDHSFLEDIINKDIVILQKMIQQVNIEDIRKAAEWIMGAEQVVIIGFRNSYPAASWLNLKLGMLRENVSQISNTNTSYNEMLHINEKTVYFVLSFPSYVKETISFAHYAKGKGAKLIVATDHLLSPAGRISDIVFTTELNINSNNLYSISAIISLLNIIVLFIEKNYEEKTDDRIRKLQDIYKNLDIYLE